MSPRLHAFPYKKASVPPVLLGLHDAPLPVGRVQKRGEPGPLSAVEVLLCGFAHQEDVGDEAGGGADGEALHGDGGGGGALVGGRHGGSVVELEASVGVLARGRGRKVAGALEQEEEF